MDQNYEKTDRKHAAAFFRHEAASMLKQMNSTMKRLKSLKKVLTRRPAPTVSKLRRVVLPTTLLHFLGRDPNEYDVLSSEPIPTDDELRKAIANPDAILNRWKQKNIWMIGYDSIASAARHVLRASRNGIWESLTKDVHPCDIPHDNEDDDVSTVDINVKWRTYWEAIVLKESKLTYPKYFSSEADPETDPWHYLKERIQAFELWADLIEGKIKTTQPTPLSTNDDSEKSASPEPAQGEALGDQDVPINDRQQSILNAMLELKAFDSDSRCTTTKIAENAKGWKAKPESYKQPMTELRKLKLVNTKVGSHGGCWLSQKGRERAQRLKGKT